MVLYELVYIRTAECTTMLTARYVDSDDDRNLANRAVALVVVASLAFVGALSVLYSQWPGPYVWTTAYALCVNSMLLMALSAVLFRCRRRSDVASALAVVILVCSFDLSDDAGTGVGVFAQANMVM